MPDAQPATSAPAAPPPAAPPAAAAPAAPAATSSAAPAAPAAPPNPGAEPAKAAGDPGIASLDVKLPEGAKFDEKVLGNFKSIMADPKTTAQEKAQKLVDLQHQFNQAQSKADQEQMQRNRATDLEKLKGDPKFGGAMFDKTRADARSILERSERGKAVSKKLEMYGLDCDPDFTALFAEFRSLISEDTTSSRVPNPVPEVQQQPQTQTERQAARYARNTKKK